MAVLYLRGKESINKETMTIRYHEQSLILESKILYLQNYSIDKLLEKKLYALIPFSIFLYEKQLPEYEHDTLKLSKLQKEFTNIKEQLESDTEKKIITAYDKGIIDNTFSHVVHGLAYKYPNILKGIDDLMGGKIIESDVKRAHEQGISEGEEFATAKLIKNLASNKKITFKEAMAELGIPLSEQDKYASLSK